MTTSVSFNTTSLHDLKLTLSHAVSEPVHISAASFDGWIITAGGDTILNGLFLSRTVTEDGKNKVSISSASLGEDPNIRQEHLLTQITHYAKRSGTLIEGGV